jgi:hypothetical protein
MYVCVYRQVQVHVYAHTLQDNYEMQATLVHFSQRLLIQ